MIIFQHKILLNFSIDLCGLIDILIKKIKWTNKKQLYMGKKEHSQKKIPTQREGKKCLDYDAVMNSKESTFEEMIGLINQYPKKNREIVEKALAMRPTLEQIVKLYGKVRNSELKEEISKYFLEFVSDRSERHCGLDEDFYFLVDSVLVENNNPFFTDITAKGLLDDILLQWQRSPSSYKTLDYLFEILFGGWSLKFYKEMAKKPELYNTPLIFTEANIKGIFRNASFGLAFPGRTPEAKESFRKSYLVEIFERLVDCAKKITLQIGSGDCCDEIEKKSLEQISLVKKYADLLYTIGAIDKEVRQKRHLALETKGKEIVDNGKKWKQKATKWVAFSTIKKLFFC